MTHQLTPEELISFTGKRSGASQCQVLDDYQVPYFTRPDGRPSTTWAAVNWALTNKNQGNETDEGAGFNLKGAAL